MSEVELYVCQTNMNGVVLAGKPATTAEIMEAHPKCGECRYMASGFYQVRWCDNTKSSTRNNIVNPTTDYCRHWEAK